MATGNITTAQAHARLVDAAERASISVTEAALSVVHQPGAPPLQGAGVRVFEAARPQPAG